MQYRIEKDFLRSSFQKEIEWINKNSPRKRVPERQVLSWSPKRHSV